MNLLELPWLEMAILATLVGFGFISRLRQPARAYWWGVTFTGTSFGCTLLCCLAFYSGASGGVIPRYSVQPLLFGRQLFAA